MHGAGAFPCFKLTVLTAAMNKLFFFTGSFARMRSEGFPFLSGALGEDRVRRDFCLTVAGGRGQSRGALCAVPP